MRIVTPEAFAPVVRIANHHPVPAGRGWPGRSLPDLQLICVLEGRFRYRDAETEVEVGPGEVCCIEPGLRCDWTLADRCRHGRMSGMHLELVPEGRWVAGDYRSDPLPARVTAPRDPAVGEAFVRAAEAWSGWGRWRTELVATIAREILLRLAAHWRGAAAPAATARGRALAGLVRTHAARGLRRGAIARALGVGAQHVNWLFRRELGMTPTEAVNRERCAIAYRLLQERGASVAAAAAAAGFADPFYFSRVFRRIYGVPPSRI